MRESGGKSFWNVNLQILLLVLTSESICSCTIAGRAEEGREVRSENARRGTENNRDK